MAIINNTNIIGVPSINAIKSPQNRVITIKNKEVTIRIIGITSPDSVEAVSMWENSVW